MSRADAERRVDAFRRSRGPELLQLATHAALPVVLDPPLLHLLRVNYFLDPPDTLTFAAEAQLLLSPLCLEIDDGLYVMGPDERDVLLQKLVTDYGGGRLRDVARLLWEYCERGTPWLARPGLAEAQQLTALNFIDPKSAQAWLERAEKENAEGGATADERWFVAMRKDLDGRTKAVEDAQANPDTAAGSLPALVELRDALLGIYGDPSAANKLAQAAGVPLTRTPTTGPASQRWQQLVEAAWATDRMPDVMAAAVKDHPHNSNLTRAIQEYWIRLSPALRVTNGHFEAPPPEWSVLEQHRDVIEKAMRSLCLFAMEDRTARGRYGMGFLIAPRTVLTHRSMVPSLPDVGWLAFANRHDTVPSVFRGASLDEASRSQGLIPFAIEAVREDQLTKACAIRFTISPDDAADFPPPLVWSRRPPPELQGRKVCALGYPMLTDSRADPTVIKRIMGTADQTLRVQPGTIVQTATDAPLDTAHNCFTLEGNAGSPLVDLEDGTVLGMHYAAHYTPGPKGLKSGRAMPWSRLIDSPFLTSGTETPAASPPRSAPAQASAAWRDTAILWVDDRPDNNINERVGLERDGTFITLALTTKDALQALTEHRFDAIISDLGRPEGKLAGFDLLQRVRQGSKMPFAIYASRRAVQLADDAKRLGATISTDRFDRIVEALSDALDGVSHAGLSDTQAARLRDLLGSRSITGGLGPDALIGAASQWKSVWQVMQSLDRIAPFAVEVVDAIANTGYCQLFRVKGDRIVLAASRITARKVSYSEASRDGVIGRVVRTGNMIHLPDVNKDSEYIPAETSTRSELAIPIIGSNAKAIGVINIESPRLSAFSGHQAKWLAEFAGTLTDHLSESGQSIASQSTMAAGKPGSDATAELNATAAKLLDEYRAQIGVLHAWISLQYQMRRLRIDLRVRTVVRWNFSEKTAPPELEELPFLLDEMLLAIRGLVDRLPADQLAWTTEGIAAARNQISEATRSSDPDAIAIIRDAPRDIARILDQESPRVNTMMVDTYRSMRLDALVAQLNSLSGGNRAVFDKLDEQLGALERLDKEVGDLVDRHDMWLRFDVEVRFLERLDSPEQFAKQWIFHRSRAPRGNESGHRLQKLATEIDDALAKGDWQRAAPMFRSYQEITDREIYQIDQDLLKALGDLEQIVTPIWRVLSAA